MTWVLIVIGFGCGLSCVGHDFKIAVVTDTREQCQAARVEFAKVPGFRTEFLLCLEGRPGDRL